MQKEFRENSFKNIFDFFSYQENKIIMRSCFTYQIGDKMEIHYLHGNINWYSFLGKISRKIKMKIKNTNLFSSKHINWRAFSRGLYKNIVSFFVIVKKVNCLDVFKTR